MAQRKSLPALIKSLSTVAVFSITAIFASTAYSQQQKGNVASSGWFKTCNEQAGNKLCNVQYRVIAAQNKQLITSLNLIEISGNVNRKIFRIIVPTARSLPEGIQVQIDGGRSVVIPYTYCRPQVCAAEAQLNDQLVKAFKAGGSIEVTSLNFQDRQNKVPVTLKGFTAAYDGEPVKVEESLSREDKIKQQLEQKLNSQ